MTSNRLVHEKSPYLRQHMHNPVAWQPWDEAAFANARAENRPIFLSIGYSTCHWCHVMAHECFESGDVAELLNRDYVSIKVDREERPDIDQVYMEACQRLTGGGGWPLTIFMTPDGHPFYAATYIPRQGRHGRPGLLDLLPWIAEKWRQSPETLSAAGRQLVDVLRSRPLPHDGVGLDEHLFKTAQQGLLRSFDRRHGGFGTAPKFPRPHDLCFLLQRYRETGDASALQAVEITLRAMRCGGIWDQLGQGLHRYSTDQQWLVPHFEKMLYDQAGLAQASTAAWAATGRAEHADTVHGLVEYLLRDLLSPEGAFYSAEDADSEGVEGKFYLWTAAEIDALLGSDAADFKQFHGVTAAGNYHDEATGAKTGANILHLPDGQPGEGAQERRQRFAECRAKLFAARQMRIRPHLDDKILVAWNGFAISALATAGRVLERPDYVVAAEKASDFILTTMRTGDGRLFRRYRDGEAAIPGFAEDYAYLACGLLDLYGATFAVQRLAEAVALARHLRCHFQDEASGTLYDTPDDGEALLVRPCSTFDGAMPAAGSMALDVFTRLYLLTGEDEWRHAGDALLKSRAADVSRYPAGYTQLLQAAARLVGATREVVVSGQPNDPSTDALLAILRRRLDPQTVVLFRSADDPDPLICLAPYVSDMVPVNGRATAYVCENFTCREPLTDPAVLSGLLVTPPAPLPEDRHV